VIVKYLPQVDETVCAAHGDCVDIAPEVFALNDTAHVIGEGPPDLIMAAAEACPSVAITVIDEESGEQLYP
jgi:ferredoxin